MSTTHTFESTSTPATASVSDTGGAKYQGNDDTICPHNTKTFVCCMCGGHHTDFLDAQASKERRARMQRRRRRMQRRTHRAFVVSHRDAPNADQQRAAAVRAAAYWRKASADDVGVSEGAR